ncbi:MAG: CopG family ribbon-helix-helix protein [Thermofilaceae archaeon]
MSESKCARVTVTIPRELLDELNRLSLKFFKSRSHAVAEAIRRLAADFSREPEGKVVGVITYLYASHHASENLRELGHKYIDVVASTLHIHASGEECLEVAVVKGSAEKVREFAGELSKVSGIKRFSITLAQIR